MLLGCALNCHRRKYQMQQRRVQRYRSVEYEPEKPRRYQVQRLDKMSQHLDRRPIEPDDQTDNYVPLYEDEERPCYDGPIPKKRATRTQALPPNQTGRIPVDRPVEPIRPRSRGWG